jgi:hypothetical protein
MKSELFVAFVILIAISALSYLPLITHFGYYNDDWYEIYSANSRGPMVFGDIYGVDRPVRLLVMAPAYALFGGNPLYWDLSAYFFRLLSAFGFLWLVWMSWPRQRGVGILMALLFLIYPGFLSQPQGIDYQSQIVALAAGVFSMALLIRAVQSGRWPARIVLYAASILLSWFYLGLVEYFIGFEVVKFACLAMFSLRERQSWRTRITQVLRGWIPSFLGLFPFLIWRVFIFHSERGATDIGRQLGSALGSPLSIAAHWMLNLSQDSLKVVVMAWTTPFDQLVFSLGPFDSLMALIFGSISVALVIYGLRAVGNADQKDEESSGWRREAFWLGVSAVVFGLLPVTIVNRQVIFPVFSRYALASSIGTAMIMTAIVFSFSKPVFRWSGISILLLSAVMIHYGNGIHYAAENAVNQNFWWQVSWRVPQMETGTTLVANVPVFQGGEDYDTWGPANMIYYPQSQNEQYPQPGLYASLLNNQTVMKAILQSPQDYENRRTIRTYANYRNILLLTQPTSYSCVQVVDGKQPEFSSSEDERVMLLAPFSEPQHIILSGKFLTPPAVPFGREPLRGWCYYYEKASYARQSGDWQTVSSLGDDALKLNFAPGDPIEWMPFLQAYAHFGNQTRLTELAKSMAQDSFVAQQACRILSGMPLDPSTLSLVKSAYCATN